MIDAIELIREIAETEPEDFDNSRSRGHVEHLQEWVARAKEVRGQVDDEENLAEMLDNLISDAEMSRKMGFATINQHNELIEAAAEFVADNEHLFEESTMAM